MRPPEVAEAGTRQIEQTVDYADPGAVWNAGEGTGLNQGQEASLDTIVRTVVLVARLGEVDRSGWWGTRSFGPAGRVVLRQRLSRTWRMAAVELDIAAAVNRHNDIIDRPNAIHLFSDNWPVRRWTSAWVAEQKTTNPPASFFEELETILSDDIFALMGRPTNSHEITGKAFRIGTISQRDLNSSLAVGPAVAGLAQAYASLETSFAVPYLEVTA